MGAVRRYCPRAKDKKRQKELGLNVQALFHNPSECNKLHPPSHLSVRSVLLHFVQRSPPETRTLYKGGKKGLFNSGVLEKRELFGERRNEWSVYYKFCKNLFKHGISLDEARFSRFRLICIIFRCVFFVKLLNFINCIFQRLFKVT